MQEIRFVIVGDLFYGRLPLRRGFYGRFLYLVLYEGGA